MSAAKIRELLAKAKGGGDGFAQVMATIELGQYMIYRAERYAALIDAADDVVKRWHEPTWKDVSATADYIHTLEKSLSALKDE